MKQAGAMLLSAIAVWGCSNNQQPESAADESQPGANTIESPGVDVPEGDFRGLRWGDPKDQVIASESKRSKVVNEGWSYETELAGYPVIVSYGYFDDGGLGGGSYRFAWPGEAAKCSGVMAAGSECSLRSAEYAIDVCKRLAKLLDEKYPSKDYLDPKIMHSSVSSPSDLDDRLRNDSGFPGDMSSNAWASERVSIIQFYARSGRPGEGWRCSFQYHPSPDIAARLDAAATASQNEAAKQDL